MSARGCVARWFGWARAVGVFGDPGVFIGVQGRIDFVDAQLPRVDGGGAVAFEPGSPVGSLLLVAGVLVVPVGPASEVAGEVGGVGRAEGPACVGVDDG